MLIHDQHNLFQIQESGKLREISLSSSTEKESLVRPEADGLVMETKYSMDGFDVIRSIGLNRGEGGADVIYDIQRNRRDIKRFNVLLDLNLGQNVRWEQTGPSSFQKSQTMKSPFGLYDIVTHTVIETSGARLNLGPSPQWGDHLLAAFELQRSEATLKFRFETISPLTHSDQPVGHFLYESFWKTTASIILQWTQRPIRHYSTTFRGERRIGWTNTHIWTWFLRRGASRFTKSTGSRGRVGLNSCLAGRLLSGGRLKVSHPIMPLAWFLRNLRSRRATGRPATTGCGTNCPDNRWPRY